MDQSYLRMMLKVRHLDQQDSIQLPNNGYDNQGCHILTFLFDQIDRLQVPKYNIYSSTLLYTNVSISTSLQGGGGVMHVRLLHKIGLLDFTNRT